MGKYAIPEKPRAFSPYLEELIFWVRRRDPVMAARHLAQTRADGDCLQMDEALGQALDRAEALLTGGQWLAAEIELDNCRFGRPKRAVRAAYNETAKPGAKQGQLI